MTSMTCKNALRKLGLTLKFEQNFIEAAIDQWRDSLRSCIRGGGRHFEHMLQNFVYL